MDRPRRIPLVYIAGSSYSGSTLTDLLLGSHPQVESLGEAKKIPAVQRSMREGAEPRCNCGALVGECPFWRHVLPSGGDFKDDDAGANAQLFARALDFRGRSFVLDNSKNHGRALMLSRSGLFDLHVLHVIRDSRAVVFSHRRKAERRTNDQSYRLWPTARAWSRLNLRLERAFASDPAVHYLRVRYEDLVADPEVALRGLLERLSLAWTPEVLAFRESRHHGIEGNRMRLGTGQEIVRDSEYLTAMTRGEWWAATALTWRGLRTFGYRLGR